MLSTTDSQMGCRGEGIILEHPQYRASDNLWRITACVESCASLDLIASTCNPPPQPWRVKFVSDGILLWYWIIYMDVDSFIKGKSRANSEFTTSSNPQCLYAVLVCSESVTIMSCCATTGQDTRASRASPLGGTAVFPASTRESQRNR